MDTLAEWSRRAVVPYGVGDLDGDHFDDFVTATNSPYIDIFCGGVAPDTTPAYHWSDWPGLSNKPFIIPDITGDARAELGFSHSDGFYLLFGRASMHMAVDAQLNFPCAGSADLCVSAGDFNDDGYGDIVMLTSYCDDSWYGTLTLHLGHPWVYSAPTFVLRGWTEPLNLIHFRTAASLGDVNGDRVDDLAIGANGGIEYLAQRGKVVILGGDTSLVAGAGEPRPEIPQTLQVRVYPNPFNAATILRFDLQRSGRTRLVVYNLLGQEVAVLRDGMMARGSHTVRWEGTDARGLSIGTGIYFARLEAPDGVSVIKLALIR